MKIALVALLLTLPVMAGSDKLVVHEWGTFTSFQDEQGHSINGINADDEPLPSFVHELADFRNVKPGDLPGYVPLSQGAPRSHPAVTMRLETPVVYFYPPKSAILPMTLDFKVKFYHGWLTEFYPDAEHETNTFDIPLRVEARFTAGRLDWIGLKVGDAAPGPVTTEHVWTAPRKVNSASLTAVNGESEKFLFYRGVGHLDAPISVTRSNSGELTINQVRSGSQPHMKIDRLWLADFREDGSCAYRILDPLRDAPQKGGFREAEFSHDNLKKLQVEMRSALIKDGLFGDEADALLNTWELSYFKSWGQRVFFLVPREWTDYQLPLEISVPAEIKRVMVGRVELVTPRHRALLKEMSNSPVPTTPWAHYEAVNGKTTIKGELPPLYKHLGRFRNALILDEVNRNPSTPLRTFIALNRLGISFE